MSRWRRRLHRRHRLSPAWRRRERATWAQIAPADANLMMQGSAEDLAFAKDVEGESE